MRPPVAGVALALDRHAVAALRDGVAAPWALLREVEQWQVRCDLLTTITRPSRSTASRMVTIFASYAFLASLCAFLASSRSSASSETSRSISTHRPAISVIDTAEHFIRAVTQSNTGGTISLVIALTLKRCGNIADTLKRMDLYVGYKNFYKTIGELFGSPALSLWFRPCCAFTFLNLKQSDRLHQLYPSAVNRAQFFSRRSYSCIPFIISMWNRAFHYFEMNRDEFLARYHRRSNAESTFSSMKRKFGDTLRSKTRVARINELLLKVLCHNVVAVIHEIHESGALPVFPALAGQTCPKRVRPAQQSLLQD